MKKLMISSLALLLCGSLKAQRTFKVFEKNTIASTKVGVYNKDNSDTLLQAKYDKIKSYSEEGYFDVELDEKMVVVDTNGKVVIPIKYYVCSNIYEGRLFVGNGDKLALSDRTGKL